MKPFLLLSIRAEADAAEEEHDAFTRFLEVGSADLERRQLGQAGLGWIDLDQWSGIVLGGGAFCVSDPEPEKSAEQRRTEEDLELVLDRVVAADFPFLGACYGIGTLGRHQGGLVDRSHPEPVGPLSVSVTADGVQDALFAGLPRSFAAYGGHKEALSVVPDGATVLATSAACPVQAFRVGANVYATQFHPELDLAGIRTRIAVYAGHGYFDPAEVASLQAAASEVRVDQPGLLLRNFSHLHAR
ncbi:glutamine amidotransferase [Nocardioides psychrotolerans]|uniref:GMP synthase (Glutamine-hydrolysing) n=1 Tax=Nocardioides psychrotolerans TaxID=1005945 RepID=A0A1I3K1T7_9ACTN|nr:glutamine amidotransferase [Nocardioides psychrotolerans]GEP38388.1 glutamine amidotransferase [Nocardioides psychrotolerans]SFI66270.1 GMP synthase (glutamine-hydrolysing) [Nocardioides psychrotolerans]